jgi:hypothetical protein
VNVPKNSSIDAGCAVAQAAANSQATKLAAPSKRTFMIA